MKVCVVTTSFPRGPQDDRGTFVWEAVRGAQRLGIDMRVVAIHSPGARVREIMNGVPVWRPRYLWPERLESLQTPGGGLPVVLRRRPLAWLALPAFFLAQARAATLQAIGCDLVHAHWTLSASAALAGKPWHHCPVIATVQGSDVLQTASVPLLRTLTRSVLSRCGHVLCLSKALADATSEIGVPRDKITVLPNAVDVEKFSPSNRPRDPIVLAVASLIERKGIRHLVAAMPAVLRAQPDCRLVVIGDGPLHADLSEFAASLGVSAHVQWLGVQPHDKVSEWMQRASLFVMPSLEEAFGQVLLEALATGTPCIASAAGGMPEIVTPDVGMLVPPADPAALASAITALMGDGLRWRQFSIQARQRAVAHFSSERLAKRLVEIYQRAIGERSGLRSSHGR